MTVWSPTCVLLASKVGVGAREDSPQTQRGEGGQCCRRARGLLHLRGGEFARRGGEFASGVVNSQGGE
eukprot:1038479-Prorocentrum_minimum.AAC.1